MRPSFLLSIFFSLFLLTACGGGSDAPSPTGENTDTSSPATENTDTSSPSDENEDNSGGDDTTEPDNSVLYEFSFSIRFGMGVLAEGDTITGSFFYQPDAAAQRVNQAPFSEGFGRFSFYDEAVVDLSAELNGDFLFFAEQTETKIVDAAANTDDMDGYFVDAGSRTGAENEFVGATVGEYTLIGATLFGTDESDYLTDQTLPAQLVKTNRFAGINLYFANASGGEVSVFSENANFIRPRQAPSNDADMDGVSDAVDQCVGTAVLQISDADGCSAEQREG